MIDPKRVFDALQARGAGLYAGVPDSLLAAFCAYLEDHCPDGQHLIAANEGNAIAVALGHYLAGGQPSVVYMQNSGLGNAVNPLVSLADAAVYRIPMLLMIGWRGEPGVKDEPQHVKQGRITCAQLDLLEIPYALLDADSDIEALADAAFARMRLTQAPVAWVVRSGAFSAYKSRRDANRAWPLSRESAIRQMLELADAPDLFVATTGKTSRELFEARAARHEAQRDFLTVGGMGHTASIALGVALAQPERRVVCLDGDGSLLMHMGALPVIGSLPAKNLLHVLLNNAAHESVGGQPTVADRVDFAALAHACGYRAYRQAGDADGLTRGWRQLATIDGPALLEVKIDLTVRADLGRPSGTPEQNKRAFMSYSQQPPR